MRTTPIGAYLRKDSPEEDIKWVHDLFPRLKERSPAGGGHPFIGGGRCHHIMSAEGVTVCTWQSVMIERRRWTP